MRAFFLILFIVASVSGQGFSTTFTQNSLFGGDQSDFGVSSWSDQIRGFRYLVGQTYSSSFSGFLPLSGEKSIGAPDIILVKLDQATDALVWYTIVGTTRSDQPRAITGDSEGNVWITGQTFGSFDKSNSNGLSRGFVIKIDSNGNTLLSKTIDSFQPTSMDSDSNGNIWIAGSATNQDSEDNSIEKVAIIILSSATGEQITSKTIGGSASDVAKTIVVAENTVAIGGITFSSDFPVTQGKRVCDTICSGAGFVMTLTYDLTNGIQSTFATYILGEESQSLSVVDIAIDYNNNMYLSIFDDSNAMGSYIQQLKSDRTLGWRSDMSDAYWKVEYLPFIDALYTIGSYSTPADYVNFYILDTKSGSMVYSSKALTGSIVDASVYALDQSTVKISMVGTLQKDLKINSHGRTYSVTHKSDDILIVSVNLRSLGTPLSHVQSRNTSPRDSPLAARYTPLSARDAPPTWCLWNHLHGFVPVNDFIYQYHNLSSYKINDGGVSVVLPMVAPDDYDMDGGHGTLVEWFFSNAGRIARLFKGTWGTTFSFFFQFAFPENMNAALADGGRSYIEIDIPTGSAGKLILRNSGFASNGDVAWTIEFQIPGYQSELADNLTFTFAPSASAPLSIWIDYTSGSFDIYAVQQLTITKPVTPVISTDFTPSRTLLWNTQTNFYPRIRSGCSVETHMVKGQLCGITEKIRTVPLPLNPVLAITGQTNFPADDLTGYNLSWIAQTIVPTSDSIDNVRTKLQFYRADGTIFNGAWAFVYTQKWDKPPSKLSKVYGPGYVASSGISGRGLLAGWVFGKNVQFTAGTKYYVYIADGLSAVDNLMVSQTWLVDQLKVRDHPVTDEPMLVYNKDTKVYDEISDTSIVYSFTTFPGYEADDLNDNDPIPPPDYTPTDSNDNCPPGETGCIKADPFFIGFNTQRYMFKGSANSIYNVYNDPWVNVNALFGYANEKKRTGTITHSLGISIGHTNLLFDITNRENRRFFDVIINETSTRIGYNVHHLSGCVDIQYNTKVLLVTTPRHNIRMSIEWGRNWHINVPYFDVHIHHPEEDLTKIGGVLGQSVGNGTIDKNELSWKVSEMFSFEKSPFYVLENSCLV